MKEISGPIMRRYFLKSGLMGGAFLSLGAMRYLCADSNSAPDDNSSGKNHTPDGTAEKLRKIAAAYGSEFGDIKGGF